MTTRHQQFLWHQRRMRDHIAEAVAMRRRLSGFTDPEARAEAVDWIDENLTAARGAMRRMNLLRPAIGMRYYRRETRP